MLLVAHPMTEPGVPPNCELSSLKCEPAGEADQPQPFRRWEGGCPPGAPSRERRYTSRVFCAVAASVATVKMAWPHPCAYSLASDTTSMISDSISFSAKTNRSQTSSPIWPFWINVASAGLASRSAQRRLTSAIARASRAAAADRPFQRRDARRWGGSRTGEDGLVRWGIGTEQADVDVAGGMRLLEPGRDGLAVCSSKVRSATETRRQFERAD